MSITINGTGNTITPVTVNTTGSVNGITPQASNMQPFNRIINGAMTIDQRNAGASINMASGDGKYCLDRWRTQKDSSSVVALQQSTDAPDGFNYSLKVTVSTAASPTAAQFCTIGQVIEGFNTNDLKWNTAAAKPITISFWVKCSIVGTYTASVYNLTGGNAAHPSTFIVNTENTWEKKEITIAGPTSGTGTWATTNAGSIYLRFDLGSGTDYSTSFADTWNSGGFFRTDGSVTLVGTSGATFYITGVQLEAGSTASSFAHEFVGDTLRKCQRYYEIIGRDSGSNGYANIFSTPLNTFANFWTRVSYLVEKRSSPALGFYSGVSWNSTVPTANLAGVNAVLFNATSFFYLEGGSGGNAPMAYVDAEL